ncbi:hypothetical protein PFICI_04006 [Pestalotiopsis fici W106-1]|uniref:Uncharacterized protein n=1 Tax=Pestalotiopsis fici (strain W106-1 / CGMCC3.15140) TaxID=1229662 RepID=W3XL47_PESFW|nr:uncharacterized protein PFICI_04006 [Pestalotiopsis fici W106-1]ETS85981.1 hypothetical protein PFICI_04006 [Pestalotiopsis fici W106-1]
MDALSVIGLHSNATDLKSSVDLFYTMRLRGFTIPGLHSLISLVCRPFTEYWISTNKLIKWPLVGLLALLATYITSSFHFNREISRNKQFNSKDRLRNAPVVPYWIPGLFHGFGFMNPAEFLLKLQRQFGSNTPLQLKAGPFRFFFYQSADDIKAAFRACKRTANKSTTLFALKNLFGLPDYAVRFYLDDNSGMGQIPRAGSNVAPHNRINYLINLNVKKYLSSEFLNDLDERFMATFIDHLDTYMIKDDWTDFPDLHAFIQSAAIKPCIESLVGSEFLKLNPHFIQDLLVFQEYTPDFLHLLPQWIIPKAYNVRKRLLESVKRWHQHAHEHYDCSKLGSDDPLWEPYFGFKLIRARENYCMKTEKMTADARASEDLGLIFTSTTNVVTSMFWFVFEALKDPELLTQLKQEVAECTAKEGSNVQIKKLTLQPLLQSNYAEVLRLYVAVAASRVAEYCDINVAGYSVPKDSYLVMYSRSSAFDYPGWERAGRSLKKPLEEFDAERFLVDADWVPPSLAALRKAEKTMARNTTSSTQKRFSVEGLLGLWYPYGGGDHICPGRHYAKHQIIISFAMLSEKFDFELQDPEACTVLPNMRYAPFGALPPVGKIPFRLRRRDTVQK